MYVSAFSSVNSSTRSFASDFKREAVSSIIAENLALCKVVKALGFEMDIIACIGVVYFWNSDPYE